MRFVLEILIIGLLFNSGYGKPAPADDVDYPADDNKPKTGNPVITTVPQEVVPTLGGIVSLPCNVIDNEGEDSVVWKHNNQTLFFDLHLVLSALNATYSVDENHTLRINYSGSTEQGNYTCAIPDRKIGITHIVRERAPVAIESVNAKKYIENMAELTITCRVQGFPTPTISWTKKNSENDPEYDLNTKNAVYVKMATFEDSGIYTCRADNGASSAMGSVTVAVINGVAPESAKVYAGQPESSAKLCCVFDKNRKLNWLKDGKAIPLVDRFTTEQEKHKNCLVILKVKEEDLGNYTCQTEKNPSEFAKIELNGAPAKPVAKTVSSTDDKSPFITWTITSILPISEYKVFSKKPEETEWKEIEHKMLTAEDKKDEITHTFSNLQNGRYNVKLEVTNKYGSNESIENGAIVVDRYEPNVIMSAKINSGAERHYRISSLCIIFVILMRLWSC